MAPAPIDLNAVGKRDCCARHGQCPAIAIGGQFVQGIFYKIVRQAVVLRCLSFLQGKTIIDFRLDIIYYVLSHLLDLEK